MYVLKELETTVQFNWLLICWIYFTVGVTNTFKKGGPCMALTSYEVWSFGKKNGMNQCVTH